MIVNPLGTDSTHQKVGYRVLMLWWGALKRAVVIPVLLGLSLFGAACAQAAPESAESEAIVHPALADLGTQLGKPAELQAKAVNTVGVWAFVYGTITGPGGTVFDYAGTPFAEAAANGGKSKTYAGLFHHDGSDWVRVDSAVGPTDVAWEGWAEKYGAPAEVFTIPAD